MKRKIVVCLLAGVLGAAMLAGCGKNAEQEQGSLSAEAETETEEATGVAELDYVNVPFDYSAEIEEQMGKVPMQPEAAAIPISVSDANGASGVVLTASSDTANTTDYYLNAYVAGSEIVITPAEGQQIASVSSSVEGKTIEIGEDGTAGVVPEALDANEPADEVITVAMADGTEYKIHTLNELMPDLEVVNNGVAELTKVCIRLR